MEYEKIINLLDNTSNKPSKFRGKNLVEINDDWRRAHNNNSKIEFKTAMLNSSLCDDSEAYIFVEGTMPVNKTVAADADANSTNRKVICKKFAPFVTEINSIRMLM